jgi:YjzC-like protein
MKEDSLEILQINMRGGGQMGQQHRFRSGQKAPNNGTYVEIGETGDGVKNPAQIKLKAGDRFPETANDNRHWTYKRKP